MLSFSLQDVEKIFNTLESIVLILSPRGEVLYLNSEGERVSGYSFSELANKKVWDFLIPDEQVKNIKDVFNELSIDNLDNRHTNHWKSKSGENRLIEWSNTFTLDDEGAINCVIATGIDITEADRSKNTLDSYKKTVDSLLVFATTDKHGVITYANDYFCELSGYSREELIGKTHRILNSDFHDKDFFKDMWQTILRGDIWKGEVKNKRKDGSEYWVSTSITAFRDYNGEIQGFSVLRADITEKLQLEDDLLTASHLSTLGELSGHILHEVSNPLSILKSQSKQLRRLVENKTISNEDIAKKLEKIEKNSQRITEIFVNMRNSLSASDKKDFEFSNIQEVIESATSLIDFQLTKEDIILRYNKDNFSVPLYCNKGALSQVFLNLIKNSMDALRDSTHKWIAIDTTFINDRFKIIISDSGPGIPQELRAKIFENRFSTKKERGGTGYGLNICQKIMKLHGGSLQLCKKDHCQGACFIMDFPSPNVNKKIA